MFNEFQRELIKENTPIVLKGIAPALALILQWNMEHIGIKPGEEEWDAEQNKWRRTMKPAVLSTTEALELSNTPLSPPILSLAAWIGLTGKDQVENVVAAGNLFMKGIATAPAIAGKTVMQLLGLE